MIWLVWRRLRIPLTVALGLAVLLAAAAAATRSAVVTTATGLGVEHCLGGVGTVYCDSPVWNDFSRDNARSTAWITQVALALPGITGGLVGAALFGTEFARGTHVFALAQSVGRLRWWATGLLVAGLPVAAATGAAVVVAGWAERLLHPPGPLAGTPLLAPGFLLVGAVPAAYTVLAFCVAASAGVLLRNPVGAVGVALLVAVAVPVALGHGVRQNYLPAEMVRLDLPPRGVEDDLHRLVPTDGLALDLGYVTTDGALVDQGTFVQTPRDCTGAPTDTDCIRDAGYTARYTTFQPDDRFWPFQLIESAILLALSALALGAGAWGVRKRVA